MEVEYLNCWIKKQANGLFDLYYSEWIGSKENGFISNTHFPDELRTIEEAKQAARYWMGVNVEVFRVS